MQPHGHVQTIENITARKQLESGWHEAEEALYEEKERAQVTLNSIGDAVLTTDTLGNITYLNVVAETMTGWSHEDAMGRPLAEVFKIIGGETRAVASNPAQRAMDEDQIVGLASDCILIKRDGSESPIEDSAAPIHDRYGMVTGAVIVFHDVNVSRDVVSRMAYLAQHDSLGQATGDQLLQRVADCLTATVRSTDTVCRQGGDEFVILLAEIEQPQDAAHVAEKLRVALAVPHFISGDELHVTMNIGISVFPDDGADANTVMQNADNAMFHAKELGRDNYQFFSAVMN